MVPINSVMDTVNWKITNPFLNQFPPFPAEGFPFKTLRGLKEDKRNAGHSIHDPYQMAGVVSISHADAYNRIIYLKFMVNKEHLGFIEEMVNNLSLKHKEWYSDYSATIVIISM